METTRDAHERGWRPLKVFLTETQRAAPNASLHRTFVLWRQARVIPPSIRPMRGWLDGARVVLWPPDVERFMREALLLRAIVSMRGRTRARDRGRGPSHAELRVALWARGWAYSDALIRRSLLTSIASLAAGVDRAGRKADFLRAYQALVPTETGAIESEASYEEALRRAHESETRTAARVAGLGRLTLKAVRDAVRVASHADLEAVRSDSEHVLDLALRTVSGHAETAPSLFFALLSPFLIGAMYMAIKPITFEDLPRNLSLFIGWRLAEKRQAQS